MKSFWRARLLWIIAICWLAGCQVNTTLPTVDPLSPTVTASEDNPFSSRTESQDGIVTAWSGEASGHQPGQISPFQLYLENQSEALWQGRYCIYLLSESWQLYEVAVDSFSLAPSEVISQSVDVDFPFDLTPGSYGLALIVQRPSGPTVEFNYIDVTMPYENELPAVAVIPRELVEIARAQCLPETTPEVDHTAPLSGPAEDVVRLFYWDYLQTIHATVWENYMLPLSEGSYRQSPYLDAQFVTRIDTLIAKGIGFDPFLCTEEMVDNFHIDRVNIETEMAWVRVRLGLGNEFDVVVVDQGDAWRIVDVICMEAEDLPAPDPLMVGITEEITFTSGSLQLPATLTLPGSDGPYPALLAITSGSADNRDNGMVSLPDYRPYRQLADLLQTKGVALLRYEDRRMVDPLGVGADATAADLLDDAAAALAYLHSRGDIDSTQVGVIGHDTGATIAAMLAAQYPGEVSFIVALAAPALNGAQSSRAALAHLPETMDIPEEVAAQMVERESRLLELVLDGDWAEVELYLRQIIAEQLASLPADQVNTADQETLIDEQVALSLQTYQSQRFQFEISYDPTLVWSKINVPVLVLYAEHGLAIFAEDHQPVLEAALAEANNEDVTIQEIDGVNHLFLTADTGSPLIWPTLDQHVPIRVIAAISDWITARVGR